jgi:hypothetical protein
MKKLLIAGLFCVTAALSAHAIGLYVDGGIGLGSAWTSLDGEDFVEAVTETGRLDELALDIGVKLGFGPFDTIPIYIVGVLGGMGHRISDDYDNYYQLNTYLLGPGVIFYPMPSMQIAASLGYSWISNTTSLTLSNVGDYDSKGGFAGDISIALDMGFGNHAFLGGFRFFGATNTWETLGVVQNSFLVSFFIRYAYRHKR